MDAAAPDPNATARRPAWRTYTRAMGYFREETTRMVFAMLLIVVVAFLGALVPVPLAIFVNIFDTTSEADRSSWVYLLFNWIPREPSVQVVLTLGLTMFGLRLMQDATRSLHTQIEIGVGYKGRTRVQRELFAKLQALSLRFHRSRPQGDTLYRVVYDVQSFHTLLSTMIGWFINVMTLVVMLWAMLSVNPLLTLVALGVIPVMWVVMSFWGGRLRRHNVAAREADSALTTHTQRALSSVGLVQAYGREDFEAQRFGDTVNRYVDRSINLHREEIVYWLMLAVVIGMGSAAMFSVGGWLVVSGSLSTGSLVLFVSYLGQLYDPINKLSSSAANFHNCAVGVRRVFEVLDTGEPIRDADHARPLGLAPRTVAFEDVSFTYHADGQDKAVLHDVNFSIEPGKMVAFVGYSGAGKTTVLNLFPRFFDAGAGRVLLDGQDVRELRVRDVRRHIALVLQENPILPATVAENIAYGRPGATEAEVRVAAELAGADDFIREMPNGYGTILAEGGSNLSGGQRQRLAISRALLTEAPILILDEPTSALDAEHERHITETLYALRGRRTVIVVSHRLSTILEADLIYVMHAGRLVEQGTHDELLAHRGYYWKMARHQLRVDRDRSEGHGLRADVPPEAQVAASDPAVPAG